ncbi:hypothetical protein acdb102_00470 [Acidothermaceae bacterium B102]|nr:hypothetical protein acdb102_00470 [Acidothermaceae bacterium B102]
MLRSASRPLAAALVVGAVFAAAPAASAGTATTTRLTARAFWPTVTTTSVLAVTGVVSPEVRGLPVRLQRLVSGHWVTLGKQPTLVSGRYSFLLTAPAAPAVWRLRVVRSAAAGVAVAVSPTFTEKVAAPPHGVVRAWGDNRFAALGDGTRVSRATPGAVSGLRDVVSVAGGSQSAYALLADGTVWGWGDNDFGRWEYESGDEPVRGAPDVPEQVDGLSHVIAISAGGSGTGYALLANGTVRAWGSGQSDALGNGKQTDTRVPVAVKGLTHVVAISGGSQSGYALRADGTVWGWGYDGAHQLGVPPSLADFEAAPTPVRVQGVSDAVAISGGTDSVYILHADGTVGGTGVPFGAADESYPPAVAGGLPEVGHVPGLHGIVAIAGGGYGGWALRANGTVMGWGVNSNGQTGDGTRKDHLTKPLPVKGLTHVTALCQGSGLTGCVLRSDRTEWAWGDAEFGTLGQGTAHARPTAGPVPGLTGVLSVAAGSGALYALVRG